MALAWCEIRPPGRSAPCPPPCGLLLDLRRTPRRPDLSGAWFVRAHRGPFAAACCGLSTHLWSTVMRTDPVPQRIPIFADRI